LNFVAHSHNKVPIVAQRELLVTENFKGQKLLMYFILQNTMSFSYNLRLK